MLGAWIAMSMVVTGAPTALHSWSDTVRLSNGRVEVEVTPSIGRITRFAFPGAKNVLWLNPDWRGKPVAPAGQEYRNIGGDKIWDAPQARWGWPPDPALDGSPHTLSDRTPTSIVLTSPISAVTGLQSRREITVMGNLPQVQIVNTLTNRGTAPFTGSVWQVMQIPQPEAVITPLTVTADFPEGWKPYPNVQMPKGSFEVQEDNLVLFRSPKEAWKVGLPAGILPMRALFGTVLLTMAALESPDGEYPDGGKARQIYSNPDPFPYMELELASPIRTLQPGESVTLTVLWRLDVVEK